jgi:hypothetical protein
MILSHRHRFIYIKTYKTASTSIEAALSAVCGPEDVITPTRPDLMAARPDMRAQNYRLKHPFVPKRPLIKRLLGRPERYYHPSVGYYEHMPAWRVRAYVGEATWASYFKFSFERNPWDRQVSWYFYKSKLKQKGAGFAEFMADRVRAYVENFDLYSQDDRITLDFVGRYESLSEDFAAVLDRLGLAGQAPLPRVNRSGREGGYREFYDAHTKALVADWYHREIAAFGYAF